MMRCVTLQPTCAPAIVSTGHISLHPVRQNFWIIDGSFAIDDINSGQAVQDVKGNNFNVNFAYYGHTSAANGKHLAMLSTTSGCSTSGCASSRTRGCCLALRTQSCWPKSRSTGPDLSPS
mmetsp:Transcript_23343/g.75525  ORF Transcript_23343/g.75525 Transcript_23343/m.75525 type:complete len:120 (+) Transcript_23343:88-447(+)